MENRYFWWFRRWPSPVKLDLDRLPSDLPATDVRYFIRIFQHIERLLPEKGFTFVLTWHLDTFDEAMKGAVVLLIGDEQHQIPSYQRHVRAIFKTSGLRPNPIKETLRLPMPIAWRVLLRDSRNLALCAQRWWRREAPRKIVTPMYEIPLGYFTLRDIDPMPVEERPLDVFFAGTTAVSGWHGTLRPSAMARKQMRKALAEAQSQLPECRVESVWVSPTGKGLSPEEYTQKLANTKIALAPRGNFDAETSRLFEAAKLGCVPVSEPLPPRWYFRDCPALIVQRWSELPDLLRGLLKNPARIQELSRRARAWWDSTISEAAVARFIAKKVSSLGSLGQGTEDS